MARHVNGCIYGRNKYFTFPGTGYVLCQDANYLPHREEHICRTFNNLQLICVATNRERPGAQAESAEKKSRAFCFSLLARREVRAYYRVLVARFMGHRVQFPQV